MSDDDDTPSDKKKPRRRPIKTPPGVPELPDDVPEAGSKPEPPPLPGLPPAPPAPLPRAQVISGQAGAKQALVAKIAAADKDPDRQGRFLIADLYPFDLGGKPNFPMLAAAYDATNEYVGAILKATEGTPAYYATSSVDWFVKNMALLRQAGGDRLGVDWFDGAYHFLKFNLDPVMQADFYLKTVDKAGGWSKGSILPIVDVELGSISNTNHNATAQQIIDCVSKWIVRVKSVSGRRVMLYGRGAMRDKNIKTKMGADVAWNPSYTKTMPAMDAYGFSLDDIVLWQYAGDGEGVLPGYPKSVPGFGACDLSVYIYGANKPSLKDLRARCL